MVSKIVLTSPLPTTGIDTAITNAIDALDGDATATAASGNVYTVLTGVSQTDGVISKGSEVILAAVAKTGAAADVTVADSGEKLTATNVEDALAEIVTKADASLNICLFYIIVL